MSPWNKGLRDQPPFPRAAARIRGRRAGGAAPSHAARAAPVPCSHLARPALEPLVLMAVVASGALSGAP